ncbi:hypothetical protein DL764_002187 [Monosporascus ibericus]|uniref:Uncharacterized protein n=1 Tax=Monosporascus ibericus TaxID=155417 RepID=A0A4V1XBZ4_9PEZI|nr:hypothetical protein DL764_002187 [Monosporascus ibericus]
MVHEYTRHKLTFPGDRLPAFSGVAAEMADALSMRYCAGLWEGNLPLALLWKRANGWEVAKPRSDPPPRPLGPGRHSTGTLSTRCRWGGPFREFERPVPLAKVEGVCCVPAARDERGQLVPAESYILLSAHVMEAALCIEDKLSSKFRWMYASIAMKGIRVQEGTETGEPVDFDNDVQICDHAGNWTWEEKEGLYCARILKSWNTYYWLVLRLLDRENFVFERIGSVYGSHVDCRLNPTHSLKFKHIPPTDLEPSSTPSRTPISPRFFPVEDASTEQRRHHAPVLVEAVAHRLERLSPVLAPAVLGPPAIRSAAAATALGRAEAVVAASQRAPLHGAQPREVGGWAPTLSHPAAAAGAASATRVSRGNAKDMPPPYEEVSDRPSEDVLEPEVFVFAGTSVVFERVDHDPHEKTESTEPKKQHNRHLFYLAHPAGAQYRTDRPAYYITSVSPGGLGNIHLETSKSTFQNTEFKALLSVEKSASDSPLFNETPEPLFDAKLKWMGGHYTWTDSDGRQVAYENKKRDRQRLVVTAAMRRKMRDALIATWCLRLWHDTAESREAKRDAMERLTPADCMDGYGDMKLAKRVGALAALGGA